MQDSCKISCVLQEFLAQAKFLQEACHSITTYGGSCIKFHKKVENFILETIGKLQKLVHGPMKFQTIVYSKLFNMYYNSEKISKKIFSSITMQSLTSFNKNLNSRIQWLNRQIHISQISVLVPQISIKLNQKQACKESRV